MTFLINCDLLLLIAARRQHTDDAALRHPVGHEFQRTEHHVIAMSRADDRLGIFLVLDLGIRTTYANNAHIIKVA
jgi:hypothetical protein